MSLHTITVDVHASWGEHPPRYRVYVDNDLLTERDFIWPGSQFYIKENIEVELTGGVHTVRVEQVGTGGKIDIRNITLNGAPSRHEFIISE